VGAASDPGPVELAQEDWRRAARGRRRVDLVVLVNGFPRLSETFVLHELLELERQGVRLHVVALRHPEETVVQEATGRLQAEVEYLKRLRQVTAEQIRAAARTYFGDDNYVRVRFLPEGTR